jgi:uncharacterized membrane protein
MDKIFVHLPPLDAFALLFFIASWVGYSYFAEKQHVMGVSLLSITNSYRLQWMREMLKRENRTMDSIMVGNLLRSITFFANTTIFILLGLMTMLGYHDKASAVLSSIPFAQTSDGFLWEIKIFLLIIIFIYGFFKYTWSLRQYNYAGIYVVAAPSCRERVDEHEEIAQKGAKLVANAARHFNHGLRAYYFGLAALAWFLHPHIFMAATAWVVFVTHRREYRSVTLKNLTATSKSLP